MCDPINTSFYVAWYNALCLPSVLWRCWLGGRKGIRSVKNWVVGCWYGYLSGARCRLAYGPADATATDCLCFSKIQIGFTFWYRLTWVVPDKGPLNGCVCVCMCDIMLCALCEVNFYLLILDLTLVKLKHACLSLCHFVVILVSVIPNIKHFNSVMCSVVLLSEVPGNVH